MEFQNTGVKEKTKNTFRKQKFTYKDSRFRMPSDFSIEQLKLKDNGGILRETIFHLECNDHDKQLIFYID